MKEFRCDKCKTETEELWLLNIGPIDEWFCETCHEKKKKKLEKKEKDKNETK